MHYTEIPSLRDLGPATCSRALGKAREPLVERRYVGEYVARVRHKVRWRDKALAQPTLSEPKRTGRTGRTGLTGLTGRTRH